MALRNDQHIPPDPELIAPHELSLSTPWLKAVAVYMGIACEKESNEFMLMRWERGSDPRKTLNEGRELTACGVNFLRKLRRECGEEVHAYANCFHKKSELMRPWMCRREQWPVDICVEEKLRIRRPPMGYFTKLHVHESKNAPPDPQEELSKLRDFKAEAAKVMDELPEDWKTDPKHYKKYRPYVLDILNPT